jgi:hypothetical protein
MAPHPRGTTDEVVADRVDQLTEEVIIGIVGKYTGLQDSYLSVIKALKHASIEASTPTGQRARKRKRKGEKEEKENEERKERENEAAKGFDGPAPRHQRLGVGARGARGRPCEAGLHLVLEWIESGDLEPNMRCAQRTARHS